MFQRPLEQRYNSVTTTEIGSNLPFILTGYFAVLFLVILIAFMYSMYCSYPTLQGDLCVTLCGARPKRIWRKRLLLKGIQRGQHVEISPLHNSPSLYPLQKRIDGIKEDSPL